MWLLSRSFFPSTSSMSKCFHTLAFKAEGAGWMLRSAISCILFCAHHRLSGCCTSTLTSSAYCVPSTLRCQLTFRKWIFDICELTQNRPHLHRGASKNRLFLPSQSLIASHPAPHTKVASQAFGDELTILTMMTLQKGCKILWSVKIFL